MIASGRIDWDRDHKEEMLMNIGVDGINRNKEVVTVMTNGGTDIKTNAQMVRAAIYARESSGLQVDGQKVEAGSLDSQVSEAMAFAERVPYYTVEEVYVEQGQLAWPEEADRRPEYSRMIADAQAGKFDVLITTSVDQLSPDVGNLVEIVRQLKRCGVGYRSIHEGTGFRWADGGCHAHHVRGVRPVEFVPERGLNETCAATEGDERVTHRSGNKPQGESEWVRDKRSKGEAYE